MIVKLIARNHGCILRDYDVIEALYRYFLAFFPDQQHFHFLTDPLHFFPLFKTTGSILSDKHMQHFRLLHF